MLAGTRVGPDVVTLGGWCARSEASKAAWSWFWAWCCEMAVPQSCQTTNSTMTTPTLRIQVKTVTHPEFAARGALGNHSVVVEFAQVQPGDQQLLRRGRHGGAGRFRSPQIEGHGSGRGCRRHHWSRHGLLGGGDRHHDGRWGLRDRHGFTHGWRRTHPGDPGRDLAIAENGPCRPWRRLKCPEGNLVGHPPGGSNDAADRRLVGGCAVPGPPNRFPVHLGNRVTGIVPCSLLPAHRTRSVRRTPRRGPTRRCPGARGPAHPRRALDVSPGAVTDTVRSREARAQATVRPANSAALRLAWSRIISRA